MNATLAASAFDSQDCRFPGCPYEATNGDGMCRDHHGRTPTPRGAVTEIHDAGGRLVPGSLAHLMEDDPEPKEPTVPDLVLCRVDGCTRASVAQKGPWKGWCGEHKHLRGKAAPSASPGHAEPAAPPAQPAPATPSPPARLEELVTLIEARRNELIDLQAEAVGLLEQIREAIAA